jgi:hypothetical protein
VIRPVVLRIGACLAAGLLVALGGPVPEAPAAESPATPLTVTIETLSPSTVPAHGRLTITGQITNRSEDVWTDLQVFMLTSHEPIRSSVELAEQAASDPAAEIGSRVVTPGRYDEVSDLAPGESTPYTLSVPRGDLEISGEPGVYWVGVHVLGAVDGVRTDGADGRARTFIPLMSGRSRSTELALLMPVEAPVARASDGRLAGTAAWKRLLAADGRLDRLLVLSGQTAHQPFTWVVDPAVLDALRSLAAGNPAIGIGPDDESSGDNGASPSSGPTSSPSGSSSPDQDATQGAEQDGDEPSESAQRARAWLDEFHRQAANRAVATLPYGALDVAAVFADRRPKIYETARRLSDEATSGGGLAAEPVEVPAGGYLPPAALAGVDSGVPVVLSDRAVPTATRTVVRTRGGATVVLADSAAGSGGPAPGPQYSALAVRQRLLSEAALHALSPDRDEPLVVSTPPYWDPGEGWSAADFFSGLDVDWLRLVDLGAVTAAAAEPAGGPTVYPRREGRSQVPFANVLATEELTRTGDVLAGLLSRNDSVDDDLARVAMLASSEAARAHPQRALLRARSTVEHARNLMADVRIEGPSFATLSSGDGPIQVTVVNGMDEPVTVGIEAETRSSDLRIHTPDPITLAPGTRAAVRLKATATGIGVHSVTLVATNSDGEPIGTLTRFNVRTSQVGFVIWLVMGLGGAILLLAVVARVVRKVRRRRSTSGPLLGEGTT